MIKLGKYKHYKGKYYQVLGVARHTETKEKMVLYKALYKCPELREEYGPNPYFVRPYSIFLEEVILDGKRVP